MGCSGPLFLSIFPMLHIGNPELPEVPHSDLLLTEQSHNVQED